MELQVFYRAVTFLNETRSIIFLRQASLPDFIGQNDGQLSNCSFDCQVNKTLTSFFTGANTSFENNAEKRLKIDAKNLTKFKELLSF